MSKLKPYNTEVSDEDKEHRLAYHKRMGELAAGKKEIRAGVGVKDFEQFVQSFPEFGLTGNSGQNISVGAAQKLSIVFTCLNILGETLGSLSAEVKQKTNKGRISRTDDPVYRLIHDRPNPYTTSFTFWSTTHKLKKAWGNAYVQIERDSNATPIALWILLPWEVTRTFTGSGEMIYLWRGKAFNNSDILHFKNYSMNGLDGISTIKQNAITIGQGLKLKEYNSNIIDDRPQGLIISETRPKDSATKANMRKSFNAKDEEAATTTTVTASSAITPDRVQGGVLTGVPILYGGMKYQELRLPADDVAFIESTNLTKTDIYGIFRIPPTFGQDWENAPYNSSEQQDIVFGKYTLAELKDFEQECTEKLFPESNKKRTNSLYVKFNLKALLAGDTESRKNFYNSMFQIGVLSANDIRELEDLPHYEGGDGYFIQGALVPIEKMAELIEAKILQLKSKAEASGKSQDETDQEAQALREEIRAEVMTELRSEMKKRLNGHFQDVESLLQ